MVRGLDRAGDSECDKKVYTLVLRATTGSEQKAESCLESKQKTEKGKKIKLT